VLVTHYMDEAEQLCDRIAVVDGDEWSPPTPPRG
jgi:ABC-type multidrug transport system ATPase subunit